jgi:hypothetical protein
MQSFDDSSTQAAPYCCLVCSRLMESRVANEGPADVNLVRRACKLIAEISVTAHWQVLGSNRLR